MNCKSPGAVFLLALTVVAGQACSRAGRPTASRQSAQTSSPASGAIRAQAQNNERDDSEAIIRKLAEAGIAIEKEEATKGPIFGVYKVSTEIYFRREPVDPAVVADAARIRGLVGIRFEECDGLARALAEAGRGQAAMTLHFVDCHLTAKELGALDGAKGVVLLAFNGSPVDDPALGAINSLPGLLTFQLSYSDVGDAGLRFLEKSPLLRYLDAIRTRLGDATLMRIRHAANVTDLGLSGTRITDAGMAVIGQFSKLTGLDISDCDVSDAGVAHLAGCKELAWLDLSGTKVTDSGMKTVGALPLRHLTIKRTNTSDACLKYLKSPDLLEVEIADTRITPEAAAKVIPRVYMNLNTR